MTENTEHRLAHICILVRDISKAVEHFTGILSVLAPQMHEQKIAVQESFAGKDRYLTAFFALAEQACEIQLLQPLAVKNRKYNE